MPHTIRSISHPVGVNAPNHQADVSVIQDLLDMIPVAQGGPNTLLKVDGITGPKTLHAIREFQHRGCGFHWPDGRVDPGGKTIQHLQEGAARYGDTRFWISRFELRDLPAPRTSQTDDTFYEIGGDNSGRRGVYWFAPQGFRLANPQLTLMRLEARVGESQRFTSMTPRSIGGFQTRTALHSERSPDPENAIGAVSLGFDGVPLVIHFRHHWIHPTTTPGVLHSSLGWFTFVGQISRQR
jgi:peptidoglycan hydrolase-like protein with peptidoglycan-binding domain